MHGEIAIRQTLKPQFDIIDEFSATGLLDGVFYPSCRDLLLEMDPVLPAPCHELPVRCNALQKIWIGPMEINDLDHVGCRLRELLCLIDDASIRRVRETSTRIHAEIPIGIGRGGLSGPRSE